MDNYHGECCLQLTRYSESEFLWWLKRKKNFNEILMRVELLTRVSIAAHYELNLLSDSCWSLLLYNRYGPWRAAASSGMSVDLIHSCFFFSNSFFSSPFVQTHCQDVLFPSRESPKSTREYYHEVDKYKLTYQFFFIIFSRESCSKILN